MFPNTSPTVGPIPDTDTNSQTTKRRGRKPKWPCGLCKYACKINCIMCSKCEQWFHNNCSGASGETLNHQINHLDAVWLCPVCDNINLSSANSDSDLELNNFFQCLSDTDKPVTSPSPCRRKVTPLKLSKVEDGWTRVTRSRPKRNQQVKPSTSSTPRLRKVTPIKLSKSEAGWTCITRPRPQSPTKSQKDQNNVNRSKPQSPTKSQKDRKNKLLKRKKTARQALNILNINCNGIRSKTAQFEILLQQEKTDVIIGTESKLGDDIFSAEIFPPHFRIFRRDRVSGGGGIFIAVRDDIPCYEITDLAIDNTELIWCQLTLKDQNILVGAFYRQPGNNIDPLTNLESSLSSIQNQSTSPYIILGGDFNVPGLKWNEDFPSAENTVQEKLLQTANDHLLSQMVPFTTRRHHNGTENILDLLFTSHPSLLHSVRPHSGLSDHSAVLAAFNTRVRTSRKPPRNLPMWKSVDENEFKNQARKLADNFNQSKPEEKTVEENWKFFADSLNKIVKQHVPHKTYSGKRGAPWFNSNLKKKIRKKEKLYTRAKLTGREDQWTDFKDYSNIVNKAIRASKRDHISDIINTDQPKKFWRYIRSKKKDNTGVTVLKVNDETLTSDSDKATALSNQFQSVFTRENLDNSSMPQMSHPPYSDMPEINVSTEGVEKLLHNIDPSKATGPDNIPNHALKIASQEIAPVLRFIFQQSINTGDLPDDWRKANISPIFKKGATTDPANYRPISLTSVCCKLLEHIIDSNLMRHLEKYNILSDAQHAFRKSRSTESQLILTIHDLTKNLDDRTTTDIAILDFSKVFDVVPHQRLLTKLNH